MCGLLFPHLRGLHVCYIFVCYTHAHAHTHSNYSWIKLYCDTHMPEVSIISLAAASCFHPLTNTPTHTPTHTKTHTHPGAKNSSQLLRVALFKHTAAPALINSLQGQAAYCMCMCRVCMEPKTDTVGRERESMKKMATEEKNREREREHAEIKKKNTKKKRNRKTEREREREKGGAMLGLDY